MAKIIFDYILDDWRLKDIDGVWEEAKTAPEDICYKDGKVGIGTEYPMYPLDVNGSIGVANGIYSTTDHLQLRSYNGKYVEIIPDSTYGLVIRRSPTSNIFGSIAVDPSKNRLYIRCNTSSSISSLRVSQNGDVEAKKIGLNQAYLPLVYGVQIGSSTGDSGKGISSGWTVYSDGRFKVEYRAYNDGLSKIMALTPVSFNWLDVTNDENGNTVPGSKSKADRDIGFIAQDLYKVIPELSKKPEDETKTMWGIDYAKLTTVLVSAVQKQQAQINEMKKHILGMEDKLTRLGM